MDQRTPDQETIGLCAGARLFFVGIGGISMGGLAEIARAEGFAVAGSDMNPSARTAELAVRGIPVFAGHSPDWIDQFQPDLVVNTAAVHDDNPELLRARGLKIQTVDRAAFLGWLNRHFRRVTNISGTHGKTTTTAMCSLILIAAGADPTVHLGAELEAFHGTVRIGEPGRLMVSEACEYMRSFLAFYSTTAAILNIDYDHVDCFSDIGAVTDTFCEFASQLPDSGCLVIPSFDPNVEVMLARLQASRERAGRLLPRVVRFGSESDRPGRRQTDFAYRDLTYDNGLPRFEVWHQSRFYCRLALAVPGLHNVHNALAAIACAHEDGGTPQAAVAALEAFRGAEGRFTETGEYRGALVVADYAHHPTAVRVTLAAASQLGRPHTWVVFQPLTFSRTRVLLQDFAEALKGCEHVILSEIYSDREKNPGDISSRHLAERINALGGRAEFADSFTAIREKLDKKVRPGDLVLVLGPENIRGFADQLTGRFKSGYNL
jgi:UDP-N-acetylmuramate--alanine ligase